MNFSLSNIFSPYLVSIRNC